MCGHRTIIKVTGLKNDILNQCRGSIPASHAWLVWGSMHNAGTVEMFCRACCRLALFVQILWQEFCACMSVVYSCQTVFVGLTKIAIT